MSQFSSLWQQRVRASPGNKSWRQICSEASVQCSVFILPAILWNEAEAGQHESQKSEWSMVLVLGTKSVGSYVFVSLEQKSNFLQVSKLKWSITSRLFTIGLNETRSRFNNLFITSSRRNGQAGQTVWIEGQFVQTLGISVAVYFLTNNCKLDLRSRHGPGADGKVIKHLHAIIFRNVSNDMFVCLIWCLLHAIL